MKKPAILCVILLTMTLSGVLHGAEYEFLAKIESLRKNSEITLLFRKKPEKSEYLLIDRRRVLGTVTVYSFFPSRRRGYLFRAVGRLKMTREEYRPLLRAGFHVGLVKKREPYKQDFSQPYYNEKRTYVDRIVSEPDKREMRLVPAGKFIMGSDHGDDDEKPERVIHLKAFYIDRFEVSNRDYYRYMTASNAAAPVSWKGEKYADDRGDYPVMVTWHEAAAYAAWAGKRLPTESEWEKAAGGMKTGKKFRGTTARYPWGNTFKPGHCNGAPYWKQGKNKKAVAGPMTVMSFSQKDLSPFGVVNMAGNVSEWTATWYRPYPGNFRMKGEYGTQYRVLRGGAWYSTRREMRITNRKFGGIPSLRSDNTGGFRCVKDVTKGNLVE